MADVPSIDPSTSNNSADSAIGQLQAVFDQAIEKSAEITKVTDRKSVV